MAKRKFAGYKRLILEHIDAGFTERPIWKMACGCKWLGLHMLQMSAQNLLEKAILDHW